MTFPKGFIWGAAASAYQIEGGAFEDGRGLSVWDMMCRKEKAIWRNQSGEVACDHYHRWRQDVALMKRIGLKAYRLSISWPRVLPEGVGEVNRKGLGFYQRLIDALLAAGIQPYVNLFHWDFPYALYGRGGWLNRDSADWFADYARVMVAALGDRVRQWMTMNEPQCFIGLGHRDGVHAPGDRLSWTKVLRAAHHALLAHGKAVQAIRATAKLKPIVGFPPVGIVKIPATQRKQDVEAARRATFEHAHRTVWSNTWFTDPVFLGRYPADGLKAFGRCAPAVRSGDMETISQELDYCGLNIYHGVPVRSRRGGWEEVPPAVGEPLTAFRWTVTPEALYWGPKFFYERYRKPILITENGMSNVDWIGLDGKVHDPQRIDFLGRYLRQCLQASRDGVPVLGYFHWSILDNFEWADGYKERFGLVYVDYPTQRRIPKDSAFWYSQVIRSNGAILT